MPPSNLTKINAQVKIQHSDWMENLHNEMIDKQTFILQFLVNDFYR